MSGICRFAGAEHLSFDFTNADSEDNKKKDSSAGAPATATGSAAAANYKYATTGVNAQRGTIKTHTFSSRVCVFCVLTRRRCLVDILFTAPKTVNWAH